MSKRLRTLKTCGGKAPIKRSKREEKSPLTPALLDLFLSSEFSILAPFLNIKEFFMLYLVAIAAKAFDPASIMSVEVWTLFLLYQQLPICYFMQNHSFAHLASTTFMYIKRTAHGLPCACCLDAIPITRDVPMLTYCLACIKKHRPYLLVNIQDMRDVLPNGIALHIVIRLLEIQWTIRFPSVPRFFYTHNNTHYINSAIISDLWVRILATMEVHDNDEDEDDLSRAQRLSMTSFLQHNQHLYRMFVLRGVIVAHHSHNTTHMVDYLQHDHPCFYVRGVDQLPFMLYKQYIEPAPDTTSTNHARLSAYGKMIVNLHPSPPPPRPQ